ncbi:MAG: hypothetical protein ACUVTH_12235 [Thermogutta sp.]
MGKCNTDKLLGLVRLRSLHTDTVTVLFFLIVSLIIYRARGGFEPRVVDLTSDAANIATMSASQDFPQNFHNDSTFSDPRASRFYVAIHVPATRVLYWLCGDYGLAFTILLFPTVFFYLVGFYYLGVVLVGNRAFAIVFTFANMILVKGPRDTAWGPFKDALPRFDHAILFALLMGLMWRLRNRLWFWCVIFLGAGLGVYIHPVSTPAMGAMLFGAGVSMALLEGRLRSRMAPLVLGGVLFIGPVIPFALPFAAASFRTPEPAKLSAADAVEISRIVEQRFSGRYLSPMATIAEYLTRPQMLWGILPGFAIATAVVCKIGRPDSRRVAAFTCGALIGLTVAAVLLPLAFEFLTPPWKGAVFRGELPRAFRYIVPLSYILALTAASEIWARVSDQGRRLFLTFLGLCVLACAVALLSRGMRVVRAIIAGNTRNSDTLSLVDAVRKHCSIEHTILPVMQDPLVIRYSALRPLAFALKDTPSQLSLEDARRWQYNARTLHTIEKIGSPTEKVRAAVLWALELGARYVVVQLPSSDSVQGISLPENTTRLFMNASFLLLEINLSEENEARLSGSL